MAVIQERPEGLFVRDDDEGLFSRDVNGQLVRLDAPTQADYEKTVTLQIDGQEVTVPLAEPLKDANGNVLQDMNGRTTPRYTTIYDAAAKLYVKEAGDEAKIPIPTLCHLPHMKPVAVCRLCVVQIYGQKRGKRAAERKLLPACQHPVKSGMEVFTMNDAGPDGERVRQSVKVVTELLAADHLKPAPQAEIARELAPFNELGQVAERCGASASRFRLDVLSKPPPEPPPRAGRRPLDTSSPTFTVDHSACVLCDRCVRACDDVMENHVIGRTGKGNTAGIGFDLNEPMGESTCVQCGECMVSCPTSAITFKPVAKVQPRRRDGRAETISAAELLRDPVFAGVPPKFLLWQQGLVVRRQLRRGQIVCRKGEPGNTAFIIKSGRLEVVVPLTGVQSSGMFGWGKTSVFRAQLTPADVIAGEMACLSGSPRTADVTVLEDAEIWEVRRNVLDRLMRLPSRRKKFDSAYRDRSLDLVLQGSELFKGFAQDQYKQIVDYLRARLSFVRVSPGQVLFRQGEPANDLYLVRLGHVRVGVHRYNNEVRVLTRGPGAIFGEIGLLALSSQDSTRTVDQVDGALRAALENAGDHLTAAIPTGMRTATCSALNYLELARLGREDFLEMVRQFPALRRRLVEQSLGSLRSNTTINPLVTEYVDQGLYEGQSILVLDMDLCTRCDECTKSCIREHGDESHGLPITRLLRDGRRFGDYLVATSCRSCTDPHCMSGCPVDSIHRGKHLQIVIEDHCIGCGLCASNCPYGNIFMVPNERRRIEAPDHLHVGKTTRVAQLKAATCDLCDADGDRSSPKPQCVASCPHEAASRMTGPELLRRVTERRADDFGSALL
ncbi:MAG: cyclic nucleotide-binding domain-containing protein [Chthoniobacterales bacterium]